MGSRRSRSTSRTTRAVGAAAVAVLFLLPLVFMFTGSLRPPGLPPPDGFEWAPADPSFDNYRFVGHLIPIWRMVLNSLFVVAIAVPVTVAIASWAGFAIVFSPRATSRKLIVVSLVALMVPAGALWVPRFALFSWVGLTDSPWPLIAPALMATTPFYVLLFALVYARIPRALFDAARLEGLSPFAIWRRVAFPLGKPAAFAVAVLAFVFHWANFVDPLVYLSSPGRFTLPLGLRALQTLEPTNHPLLLAAAVIASLPAIAAFLIAQRAFFAKTLGLR